VLGMPCGEGAVDTLGPYEILDTLGQGTTGTVYKAQWNALNRMVALKALRHAPESDFYVRSQRFLREARVLASLTGGAEANIPTLHAVMEHDGQRFHVRELVDGNTLEQLVTTGSVDLRTRTQILHTVAGVVQRVHARGFAHRQLYPSNVLVSRDGIPKLIGFGFVGVLEGSEMLGAGASGVPVEVDVRALQRMLSWLCARVRPPIPLCLDLIQQPGSIESPAAFAEALGNCLREL